MSGVVARVDDDVVLEVDDLLQAGRLHVEQGAEAARHGLEEPDVDDRRGQLDVAHALAADAAVRHLDAAAVADHPLVLHAAVLAAGAFPVLLRPEDALAEQAVLLGAVGAVVDRLRLLDLAERPAADVVRAGQRDPDGAVVVDAIVAGRFAGLGGHGGNAAASSTYGIARVRSDCVSGLRLLSERRSVSDRRTSRLRSLTLRLASTIRPASSPAACSGPGRGSRCVSTSKLAGVPASSVFSPLTIDS